MGFEAASRRAGERLGAFAIDVANRWTTVLAAARTPAGLSADHLAAFTGSVIANGFDFWMGVMTPMFGPLLPTVLIEANAAVVPGGNMAGTAFVEEALPAAAVLTATPLVFVGDPDAAVQPANPAPLEVAAPVVLGQLREEIQISLAVPAARPAPPRGIYEGLVLEGATAIARVTARLI
jgi:hypothetical protein